LSVPPVLAGALAGAFAGALAGVWALFSIDIEVVFTLLFSVAGALLTLAFAFPALAVSAAASASLASFASSASVAALVSLASSFRAAAFLFFVPLGVASSSGPSAIWKLIRVPKRGLSAR